MIIKKTVTGLAAGAALALFLGAGSAQAGFSATTTLSMTPNPATAGQSVTLGATVASFGANCTGSVNFKETVANSTICTSNLSIVNPNTSTASCTITPAAGSYSVRAETTGMCVSSSTISTLTVNAAPAAVPTVGEWTMWGLAGLLLIGGGAVASRRFRATAA